MENREIFITNPEDFSSKGYLFQEINENLDSFPQRSRKTFQKLLAEEDVLKENLGEFNADLMNWWKEKYGFALNEKAARHELLLKKYAPEKARSKARNLQVKLFNAVGKNDEVEIAQLKKEYREKYPDQLEGVEILFGLQNFLLKQKLLEKELKYLSCNEIDKNIYRDLAKYNFLITHFVLMNGDDKKFLNIFWRVLTQLSENIPVKSSIKSLNRLKLSVLSQIAAYKILEKLEKNPKLSHPDEDAFRAIDMWIGSKAVQVKRWDGQKPILICSDKLILPSIEACLPGSKRKTRHFNGLVDHFGYKIYTFFAKINEYGKEIKKNIEGYAMIIPVSKIDHVNGEPDTELVEFFKKEIFAID